MQQHLPYLLLIGMLGDGLESIQRWAAYHHERLDGEATEIS